MEFLRDQLCERLGLEPSEVGERDNLMDLGVDSMEAIRLKGLLETELGLQLSSALAFDHPNLASLAELLLEKLGLLAEQEPPPPRAHRGAARPEPVDDLSEERLAELLLAELHSLHLDDRGRK